MNSWVLAGWPSEPCPTRSNRFCGAVLSAAAPAYASVTNDTATAKQKENRDMTGEYARRRERQLCRSAAVRKNFTCSYFGEKKSFRLFLISSLRHREMDSIGVPH